MDTTTSPAPGFVLSDRLPMAWPDGSSIAFPEDTLVVAIGDVHGQAAGFARALDLADRIGAPGKRRVLVLTGDLIDRGPDTPGVLRLAADALANTRFDEVHYLPGNHELLMLDTLESTLAGGNGGQAGFDWARNGGMEVLKAYCGDDWVHMNTLDMARVLDAALPSFQGLPYREALRAAPSHLRFGDVLFVHAGLDLRSPTPFEDALALPQQAHLSRDRAGMACPSTHERHWAWVRDLGQPAAVDQQGRRVCVVHGHTVARGADTALLHDTDALVRAFDSRADHGRVCIDGGAQHGLLVAGAAFTAEGMRLFACPC